MYQNHQGPVLPTCVAPEGVVYQPNCTSAGEPPSSTGGFQPKGAFGIHQRLDKATTDFRVAWHADALGRAQGDRHRRDLGGGTTRHEKQVASPAGHGTIEDRVRGGATGVQSND